MTPPTPPQEPAQECPRFDPRAARRVGVILAPHKPEVIQTVREVVSWFAAHGVQALLRQDQAAELGYGDRGLPPSRLAEESDFLLALGGDGTLLHAARLGAPLGKPILGVNLGGFGFLSALSPSGLFEGLGEIMSGRFRLHPRLMVQAEVLLHGERLARFAALNDIVIAKGAIARLFRLTTRISGEAVSNFPADGIIVATPTGSTGYALSAGGPVVDPEVRALLVTPICAHTLSARTLLVPTTRVITIALPAPAGEEMHLTADGQESMSLRGMEAVEIREAPFSACLIELAHESFYARLREKLGWGGPR